jgi:hypothetical protein
MVLLLGEETLQVVPLAHVCTFNMLNIPCADVRLSGFVPTFREGCNIWYIHPENVDIGVLDLFKAFEPREERSPISRISLILTVRK